MNGTDLKFLLGYANANPTYNKKQGLIFFIRDHHLHAYTDVGGRATHGAVADRREC